MRDRVLVVVLTGVCMITVLRVAATHSVFSPTWDEPAHIYAGYEYLVNHKYEFDKSHPPLARIAFAFPLRDARPRSQDVHERIGDILESRGDYMAGVVAARRGNLLFLAIAIVGVWLFASDRREPVIGVVAVILFVLLPAVLAHGGLATTDLPVAAALAVACAVFSRWLQRPGWFLTAALATAVGSGMLTKFSFPIYFGIAALAMVIAARKLNVARAAAALVGAFAVVWAGYFFRQLPRFFTGFADVLRHNSEGHDAYFLGHVQKTGSWEYFPVVLGLKTPIAFLVLAGIGIAFSIRDRRDRHLVAMAGASLLALMFSHINLGVRHILPLYVPLAVLAATGAVRLWRGHGRWIVIALASWLVVNSITAHPDYLPWMNAFAGRHPERVVLDSNFDWGQDVVRLRDVCRELGVREIGVELVGTVDYGRIGMPPTRAINPTGDVPGWYAVSEGFIIPAQVVNPSAYRWLTAQPSFRRVGKTIRLYQVVDPIRRASASQTGR